MHILALIASPLVISAIIYGLMRYKHLRHRITGEVRVSIYLHKNRRTVHVWVQHDQPEPSTFEHILKRYQFGANIIEVYPSCMYKKP